MHTSVVKTFRKPTCLWIPHTKKRLLWIPKTPNALSPKCTCLRWTCSEKSTFLWIPAWKNVPAWSNEDSRSSILYPPTDQYSMNCPSNKLQLMGVPLVPNAHVYSELVPKNSQSHEFPLGKRFWLESGVLPQAKINISFLFLAYAAIYM